MGRLTRLGAAALVLYGVMTLLFTYLGSGVEDRVGSIVSQENIDRFRATAFGQLFYAHLLDTPLGVGLGSATIAGRHFTDFSKMIFVESYLGVIVAETGILGLIAWCWLILRIVLLLLANRLVVKTAPWSPLWYFATALILQIIAFMPTSTVVDSAPGNMYFWFLIGVVVRLADHQRVRVAAAAPAAAWASREFAPQYSYDPRPAASD
jgi:hypothetical protein